MTQTNVNHLDKLIEKIVSRPKIWEYAGIDASFETYDNCVVLKASKDGMDVQKVTEQLYNILRPQMESYTLQNKPVSFLPFYRVNKKVA